MAIKWLKIAQTYWKKKDIDQMIENDKESSKPMESINIQRKTDLNCQKWH